MESQHSRGLRRILGVSLLVAIAVAVPVLPSDAQSPPQPEGGTTWLACNTEYHGCTFSGRRDVRYLLNGQVTNATSFGGVQCSAETFGLSMGGSGAARCEYSSTILTNPIANPSPGMAGLGASVAVPLGHPGSTKTHVAPFPDRGAPADIGAFRTNCAVSHFSFDDPIVYPGQPGRAHLHMFFGNTGANAFSTAQSIANSGGSTCAGGILNRTSYWMPALIDGSGQPVLPSSQIFYYKTGYNGIAPAEVQPLPAGLRMVTGKPTATKVSDVSGRSAWGCYERYIPTTPTIQEMARLCGAGNTLNFGMSFPQCWNGQLDSPDHMSHMTATVNGRCPATHPTPLPEVTFNVRFTIPADLAAGWHLSSDMYDYGATGGGLSAHIDWFNGWDPATMNTWLRNCDQASVDCHGYLLGDGRILEDPTGTTVGGDETPSLAPVAPASVGPASAFTPLTVPQRILDTRPGSLVGYTGPKPTAGQTVTLPVLGVAGLPSANVSAVVLNLTATEATGPGFVTAWPSGTRPTTSNVNLERPGHTRPNLVTVPVGPDGAVRLYISGGTHLVADVFGYFTPASSSAAGRMQFVDPTRVLDTRPDSAVGYSGPKPGAAATVVLPLLGQHGLPTSGVSTVVLNVTGTEASAPGYVTVWPQGTRPTTSNVNLTAAGDTTANQVVVPVGADGAVRLFTQSGTHLVVDLVGWYTDASGPVSGAGLFIPVTPYRLIDTRSMPRRNAGSTLTLLAAAAPAAAAGRAGLAMNVTATETDGSGWVAVWPGGPWPTVSSLNVTASAQTVANHVVSSVSGAGAINVRTSVGMHVIVDISGWYTAAG